MVQAGLFNPSPRTEADLRLTLVKDADHRFSSPQCLSLLTEAVEDVIRAREALPVDTGSGLQVSNLG